MADNCCKAPWHRYDRPWSFLSKTMWPLTSTCAKRIGGPKKFRPSRESDFQHYRREAVVVDVKSRELPLTRPSLNNFLSMNWTDLHCERQFERL